MHRLVLVFGLLLVASVAGAEPPLKNLQVLPKDTTRADIKQQMKSVAKALGVECDHCHDVPDMASDANPKKKIAREMMRMTMEINGKWLKGMPEAEKHPVGCVTCHRGKAVPENQ